MGSINIFDGMPDNVELFIQYCVSKGWHLLGFSYSKKHKTLMYYKTQIPRWCYDSDANVMVNKEGEIFEVVKNE